MHAHFRQQGHHPVISPSVIFSVLRADISVIKTAHITSSATTGNTDLLLTPTSNVLTDTGISAIQRSILVIKNEITEFTMRNKRYSYTFIPHFFIDGRS